MKKLADRLWAVLTTAHRIDLAQVKRQTFARSNKPQDMSTGSVSQEDSSCSNSISSSPESHAWSPTQSNDDGIFLQPISPTLPLIKSDAQQSTRNADPVTNKKERRRTQNINSAFADLRGCIPNVPMDTKLSKIKTLRLAISYIQHLMQQLNDDRYNMMMAEANPFMQNANNFYQQYLRAARPAGKVIMATRGMKRTISDRVNIFQFLEVSTFVMKH